MTETPHDYDREYTTTVSATVRRRLGYSHDRGNLTRFVVQLEYRHDGEWHTIVRYDHGPESERGHDVEAEGLHIDIYRDEAKYRTDTSPHPCLPESPSIGPKTT